MPARTGEQYIERLRASAKDLWIAGERVSDVTSHPAFAGCARSLSALYDMQHDPIIAPEMTFESTSGNGREGLSFIAPTCKKELEDRGNMMLKWAQYSGGILGRTPDYMNVILMACSAASDFFGQRSPDFASNIRNYYQYVMSNDLTLTHTLVNVRRSKTATGHVKGDDLGLHLVKETDSGIVVKGARILATLAPISDEILVFPSSVAPSDPSSVGHALAFGLPCDTQGMKLLCRESLDLGRSNFDHPLGSRFDEGDAVVIFDDVLVPWERVFVLNDVEIANGAFSQTQAGPHISHQIITKNLAKAEFLLGMATLMTETLGTSDAPHIQSLASELVTVHGVTKACLTASMANAEKNEWGIFSPDPAPLSAAKSVFTTAYPRLIEILQLLGSSSLMAIPTESDFDSEIGEFLENYLSTDKLDGRSRVKLFRMAWDLTISSFGNRQVLYERFFGGDPFRTSALTFDRYGKEDAKRLAMEVIDRY